MLNVLSIAKLNNIKDSFETIENLQFLMYKEKFSTQTLAEVVWGTFISRG